MNPIPLILLMATPATASTVVWNALEGEYQRQLPALFAIAPKGCRLIRVAKDMRLDRVEPILDCDGPKMVAGPIDAPDLFADAREPVSIWTTPARGGSGTPQNTTGSGSHGPGFFIGSSTSTSGGTITVLPEITAPSPVPLPSGILALFSALLLIWHFGGRKHD